MRAPVRFPREFYLDVCREIVTKRRAYSIVPRIRLIRGILVGSYTGARVAPERRSNCKETSVKEAANEGKVSVENRLFETGRERRMKDRATKERLLGRGVKLRATRLEI